MSGRAQCSSLGLSSFGSSGVFAKQVLYYPGGIECFVFACMACTHKCNQCICTCVCEAATVWLEILAGNLFWRIGGFESNPPIFPSAKLLQCDVIVGRTVIYMTSIICRPPSFKMSTRKLQTLKQWNENSQNV